MIRPDARPDECLLRGLPADIAAVAPSLRERHGSMTSLLLGRPRDQSGRSGMGGLSNDVSRLDAGS